VHPVDDLLAAPGDPGPLLGDRDDPGAPVGAGRPALGEPGLLQGVDRHHHGRLVHVADPGELDLGALLLQGVDEDAVHPRREADLGQRGRHPGAQHMAGVVQEEGEVGLGAGG
jgi:hypothetical protein